MEIYVKVKEILEERNITQLQLAEMTGIRRAGINEICRNQTKAINRDHIVKIAEALNIKDLSEIIELRG
ncbi:helix-turn-helix domain-containing protein [Niallia circulans]|uniref:helix-turn-helix domain-containing protein n=1 Tax=Niallia circulans TaxID=1397 RepID=UPI00077C2DF8|nr:helix-turn-helix transcriptional regulator [Niallia circulans]MDR4318655.1 helix-turn-helix transcriptional regulator [Niallia circulans]MED3839385.1 helix-turn-helix transcriptional regulator [Niallia circulans]MED4245368.1 helix-turn-helix transcriptional regulator [Niallia circulans]MED4250903.1 helix-turn-helix transcriptional regulator [Niallia circulans]QKH60180.1 helix-turn-helix transcriptional regulator [Niallia circulans]